MKKLHPYALLLLIGITFLNLLCTKKDEGRIVILYETDYFPDSIKSVIENVVKKYDQEYKLPYDTLRIRDTTMVSHFQEGHHSITQARTFDLTIKVNRLTAMSPLEPIPLEKKHIRDLIAHELFHTLKPKKKRFFPKPIETGVKGTRSKFVTCSGLNLAYDSTDNEGGFTLFEESSAELLAHYLYPDFEPSDDYFPVGQLLGVILNNTKLRIEDILIATKSNNFEMIVSRVYDKPIANLRENDYIFLTHAFIHHMRNPESDPTLFPEKLKNFIETY